MSRAVTAMTIGGSHGGFVTASRRAPQPNVEERRQRQFTWTDPRSEWMADRIEIDFATENRGGT